jgi:hypothetical protein
MKNQSFTAPVYALATLEHAVCPATATMHVVALMHAAAMACVATIAVRIPLLQNPMTDRLRFG